MYHEVPHPNKTKRTLFSFVGRSLFSFFFFSFFFFLFCIGLTQFRRGVTIKNKLIFQNSRLSNSESWAYLKTSLFTHDSLIMVKNSCILCKCHWFFVVFHSNRTVPNAAGLPDATQPRCVFFFFFREGGISLRFILFHNVYLIISFIFFYFLLFGAYLFFFFFKTFFYSLTLSLLILFRFIPLLIKTNIYRSIYLQGVENAYWITSWRIRPLALKK